MIINHNITALNTHRQMGNATSAQANSMEKLSSGLRINSAKDDAAGLSISEKMRGQIRGLEQASRNAQDGISLLQTAEGGMNEVHSILQRMNELATQGANETLSDNDRAALQKEVGELNTEIGRISEATKFNGEKLLDGSFGSQLDTTAGLGVAGAAAAIGITSIDISGATSGTAFTLSEVSAGQIALTDDKGNVQEISATDSKAGTLNFDKLGVKLTVDDTFTTGAAAGVITTDATAIKNLQIGSENDTSQRMGVSISAMSAEALNVDTVDLSSAANARTAMDDIQTAIDKVSLERSTLGAWSNRLEHTINNLNTSSENLTAAESRIRDVDYAEAA
ncbi:MAG: flagellin [Planococcus citreus]